MLLLISLVKISFLFVFIIRLILNIMVVIYLFNVHFSILAFGCIFEFKTL